MQREYEGCALIMFIPTFGKEGIHLAVLGSFFNKLANLSSGPSGKLFFVIAYCLR